MIIELRLTHEPSRLILIPTPEEARTVENVLGNTIQDDSGLISRVRGEYKMADGYGPAYLTLWLEEDKPSS